MFAFVIAGRNHSTVISSPLLVSLFCDVTFLCFLKCLFIISPAIPDGGPGATGRDPSARAADGAADQQAIQVRPLHEVLYVHAYAQETHAHSCSG